jgi:hypothetical protein
MNDSNVTSIYYFDKSLHTINAQISFYEWYNGTTTFVASKSWTANEFFYWNITGLNNTRTYIAVLRTNTTNSFNIPNNKVVATVYPLSPYPHHSFDLEQRITNVFGDFTVGSGNMAQTFTWIGFFLSFIPLIILTLFDPAHVGIGILATGFSMAGIQAVLASWTTNWTLSNPSVVMLATVTPVIIVIGILYMLAQRNGQL